MPTLQEPKKINLEKEMYDQARSEGLTFAEFLESKDTSEQYKTDGGKETELSAMSAFERRLMAEDIRVSGANASLVESFFKTTSSSVLFPEFVRQNVDFGMRQGRLHANVTDIVSTTSQIDSGAMKGIEVDLAASDLKHKRVAEAAAFPTAKFKTKEKSIDLKKIGVTIDASYEAIRRTKSNVFAAVLQVIGMQLNRDIVTEAVSVLVNGDGNSNPAANVDTDAPGIITYADILKLFMAADEGFEFTNLLAPREVMEKILTIAEFRDPLIASEFLTRGKPTTPLGLVMKVANGVAANKILAFNKTAGIEMIEEQGGQLVEVHKLIDRQIQGSVISKVIGFSKIFRQSATQMSIFWH